ncbi:MAG: nucleoside hydrolase [Clostridiales bacterium]|nr:nucleoside hydrolase [Clostridiales bacterium]
MKYHYHVPEHKKVRVIIDTDAKNEADDQYAIVHALLTEKFDVRGIIAAHFGNFHSEHSMLDSYEECIRISKYMGTDINIYHGAERAINSKTDYEYSEGADLIVREALLDDSRPLYVLFMGPITDMACALLKHPEIEGRVTAIWNGGGQYPDGSTEFNLSNDILAANIVMSSKLDIWQIPADVVAQMAVGIAELEQKVRPYGKIGRYLFEQLVEFNDSKNAHWTSGETWCLGDNCTVGALLHQDIYAYTMQEAPGFNDDMTYIHNTGYRCIRIYHKINASLVLGDLFAKLALCFPAD